jgi:excisionase family DNA binding protein
MFEVQSQTLTAKQASQYIGVSYDTLLKLVRQGQIKHFRGGNRILFRQNTLDQWMTDCEEASIKPAK